MGETEQAIKRLRNGKSPGIDNIQAKLFKESLCRNSCHRQQEFIGCAIKFEEVRNGQKTEKVSVSPLRDRSQTLVRGA